MALESLPAHLHIHNGKEMGGRRHWETTAPDGEPHTYKMDFPTVGAPRNFPGEGFRGRAAMQTAMRVHFFHRHVRDTVIILEEGKPPTHGDPGATCWCHGGH